MVVGFEETLVEPDLLVEFNLIDDGWEVESDQGLVMLVELGFVDDGLELEWLVDLKVLVVAALDCVDLKHTVVDACLDEELEALDDLELERLVLLDVDFGKEAEALDDVELCWLVGAGVELDNFGLLLE
jgi:hypothetical protein